MIRQYKWIPREIPTLSTLPSWDMIVNPWDKRSPVGYNHIFQGGMTKHPYLNDEISPRTSWAFWLLGRRSWFMAPTGANRSFKPQLLAVLACLDHFSCYFCLAGPPRDLNL
ncbi:hypothetical protein J6590_031813 [Homalodisca vitripennis]|nr:hypothetical protein J6590_031813 [Homalodisca vitripennis]